MKKSNIIIIILLIVIIVGISLTSYFLLRKKDFEKLLAKVQSKYGFTNGKDGTIHYQDGTTDNYLTYD